MRTLVFTLLLASCLLLSAQARLVSYQAESKELSTVFKELEKTYDIHFAFSVDEIKGRKATIDVENTELSMFLTSLLTEHQLSFEIIEENFISITRSTSIFLRMSVRDGESKEILPFATARIKGTYKGYIADLDGIFEIVVADPSNTVLEFSFLGYEKQEIAISAINPSIPIEIELQRGAQELREVVVKEYLNKGITIDDQASKITVDVQDMEILPGLSERDILLSAQILAGIGSADESAGGLNVRGSSRDNTLIYWNKIPVYQPAHYFGNISSFIPSAIGKVDIYKNYIPVPFGGSSSGLLLVNSRSPKTEKPVVESNLNLTHGDLWASLPFADYRGRISLGARRSFNDVLATPTFNSISNKLFEGSLTEDVQGISDDFEYNSKLVFSDLNFVIEYKPSGNDEFSISTLNSQSKLDYDSQDDENFLQSIQEHNVRTFGGNFSWTRRWHDKVSSELSTSYADYHMDYSLVNIRNEDDGSEDDRQTRSNDLKNLESRLSLTYSPIKNHVIDAGYQLNKVNANLTINEDFFFEEDFTESIATDGFTHGLFLDYFGKFESGLQFGLGVRHNHYEAIGSTRMDRQVRLNYEPLPGLLFKSTAGVYHQYISSLKEVDFVFSNTIEQNWITADREEEIPIVKNEQVVLGVLFTKGGWVIDIDGYKKRVFAPVARNFGFRLDEEDLISGFENITGLDFTLKKRWKKYRAWLSYTFQDSEVEAAEQKFLSGLNIRHQLQLSQTFNYKQFEFSLGYTIKSGLPYTNATTFEQVIPDDEDEEPFLEIEYGTINTNRLPTYQRLDVSAWYKFKAKKPSSFSGELGISILNVFNSNNLYSRSFSIEEDENDQTFLLRSDRRLIGITPNVSIRLRL